METNRHQYDQNELVAAWMHKNKHQVALLGNNMNMHDYNFGTCNVFDM